jgi:hypothetical protein
MHIKHLPQSQCTLNGLLYLLQPESNNAIAAGCAVWGRFTSGTVQSLSKLTEKLPTVPHPLENGTDSWAHASVATVGVGNLHVSFLQSLQHSESLEAGHSEQPQKRPMSTPGSASMAP